MIWNSLKKPRLLPQSVSEEQVLAFILASDEYFGRP
jgi:hypothetical protein